MSIPRNLGAFADNVNANGKVEVTGINATGTPSASTALLGDGTWGTVTTSPAGFNTQIQYNNAGAFGASSNLVFDGTNLGLGTSSPQSKLHVVGNIRSSNGAGTVFSTLATDGVYATGTDLYLLAPTGYSLIFYANNSEKFRFGTAGQLGIGGANYGTSGQVLTSAGSGSAPTWVTPAGGAGAFVAFGSTGGL